jgi:hypothetical protein
VYANDGPRGHILKDSLLDHAFKLFIGAIVVSWRGISGTDQAALMLLPAYRSDSTI